MPKNKLFISLLALILIYLIISLNPQSSNDRKFISINNKRIIVEIANDEKSRQSGLSDRKLLGKNEGMLFIFPQNGIYSFWMNKMKFSLDFVFIKENKIVDLSENVPFPRDNELPVTVQADEEFDKVLEINAGMIKELNINIGDLVKYNL